MMKKIITNRSAFTLVELLTAVTVFALFVSVLTSSYLMITRADRDTNELRKLYSEGRFIMDEIVQTARGSKIDRECLDGGIAGSEVTCNGALSNDNSYTGSVIALQTGENERTIFKFEACSDDESTECGYVKKLVENYNEFGGPLDTGVWQPSNDKGFTQNGDYGFQKLSLESVEVSNLYFELTPVDPLTRVPEYLTINMTLQSNSALRDSVSYDMQTTVSLRNY